MFATLDRKRSFVDSCLSDIEPDFASIKFKVEVEKDYLSRYTSWETMP